MSLLFVQCECFHSLTEEIRAYVSASPRRVWSSLLAVQRADQRHPLLFWQPHFRNKMCSFFDQGLWISTTYTVLSICNNIYWICLMGSAQSKCKRVHSSFSKSKFFPQVLVKNCCYLVVRCLPCRASSTVPPDYLKIKVVSNAKSRPEKAKS